jgi:hypothetical protein
MQISKLTFSSTFIKQCFTRSNLTSNFEILRIIIIKFIMLIVRWYWRNSNTIQFDFIVWNRETILNNVWKKHNKYPRSLKMNLMDDVEVHYVIDNESIFNHAFNYKSTWGIENVSGKNSEILSELCLPWHF